MFMNVPRAKSVSDIVFSIFCPELVKCCLHGFTFLGSMLKCSTHLGNEFTSLSNPFSKNVNRPEAFPSSSPLSNS